MQDGTVVERKAYELVSELYSAFGEHEFNATEILKNEKFCEFLPPWIRDYPTIDKKVHGLGKYLVSICDRPHGVYQIYITRQRKRINQYAIDIIRPKF